MEYRDDLEFIPAIGKFHLAAHILDCFWKYSLNFIKGAGRTAGEILEALWADLNKISEFVRGMSPAHRQEVIDDVMIYSNWKKLTGMHRFLISNLKRAQGGLDDSTVAFRELSKVVGEKRVKKWSKMERNALLPGGIGFKVYESADVPSEFLNRFLLPVVLTVYRGGSF